MTIRVLLADDHPIVLEGLEGIFSATAGFKVIGRCADGDDALRDVRALKPDVLVLDLNMPRKSGLDVLREMHKAALGTKVVLLAAELSDDEVTEALQLGVRGILLKELASSLLISCVRKVYAGGEWLETQTAGHILTTLLSRQAEIKKSALTPRQRAIVQLVACDTRNREISKRLAISEGTVKVHLRNIFKKLNVDSRLALALYAQAHGLAGSPHGVPPSLQGSVARRVGKRSFSSQRVARLI